MDSSSVTSHLRQGELLSHDMPMDLGGVAALKASDLKKTFVWAVAATVEDIEKALMQFWKNYNILDYQGPCLRIGKPRMKERLKPSDHPSSRRTSRGTTRRSSC
ncbi:uncharacterized protein RHO17_010272 isoform 1-T1 [Thomomys bottae]